MKTNAVPKLIPAVIPFLLFVTPLRSAEPGPLDEMDAPLAAALSFEHGKDAGALEAVERLVLRASGAPETRAAAESKLLAAVEKATTKDARAFLCGQIATVASERSVPKLEALLEDPDLSHMARSALEWLDAPEACAALLRAAARASGKLQAGILGSIARKRCVGAVPVMAPLVASADASIAAAAVDALGAAGTVEAVRALVAARSSAPPELQLAIDDALLRSAARLASSGDASTAARVYEGFRGSDRPLHLRLGALRGLAAAGGPTAVRILVDAIQSPDAALAAGAIELAGTIEGSEATEALAGLLPTLPAASKELLIATLGARGDRAAVGALFAATRAEAEGVRAAAWEALGSLGTARVAEPMLLAAASGDGRPGQAARASLARLRGEGIGAAIVRAMGGAEPKVRIEGLRALAARGDGGEFPHVRGMAQREEDPSVRLEAIRCLGRLAGPDTIPSAIELFLRPREPGDRAAIEEALAAGLGRIPDRGQRAELLLPALAKAPAGARAGLLRLLGGTGAPAALPAVRAALKDDDAGVREAALRALAGWPDATPAEELLALATELPDAGKKSIALGGYVRMAGLAPDPTAAYARALERAAGPEELKIVLGGLGTTGTAVALDLVEKRLRDPDEGVRGAAAAAVVAIADRLRATDASRSRAALGAVLADSKDPGTRQRAQEILNQLDQFEGHILAWTISGPWTEKGKESRAVFDQAFPPEDPDAKDVAWKRFRRGIGAWDINLAAALDPLDHAAAYVRARVWSPVAGEARLEIGSDDAVKVWLDGKLVHANYLNRGLAPRQDAVAVRLAEGWNRLVLKVVNHSGPWGFCCRVRAPDGTALEGLKVEPE